MGFSLVLNDTIVNLENLMANLIDTEIHFNYYRDILLFGWFWRHIGIPFRGVKAVLQKFRTFRKLYLYGVTKEGGIGSKIFDIIYTWPITLNKNFVKINGKVPFMSMSKLEIYEILFEKFITFQICSAVT